MADDNTRLMFIAQMVFGAVALLILGIVAGGRMNSLSLGFALASCLSIIASQSCAMRRLWLLALALWFAAIGLGVGSFILLM